MSLPVYDNFDRPGYSLADYSEKWTMPYGLGEMRVNDTRDFSGGWPPRSCRSLRLEAETTDPELPENRQ